MCSPRNTTFLKLPHFAFKAMFSPPSSSDSEQQTLQRKPIIAVNADKHATTIPAIAPPLNPERFDWGFGPKMTGNISNH